MARNEQSDRWPGFDATCRRYKPMGKEREYALVAKAQGGCVDSRNALIEAHLPFMLSEIRKGNPHREYAEHAGVATEGMIDAIEKFDMSKGHRLISYARWWIMARVKACEEKNAPGGMTYARNRQKVYKRMDDHGETFNDAARALGFSTKQVANMLMRTISYDQSIVKSKSVRGESSPRDEKIGDRIADPNAAVPGNLVYLEELHKDLLECVDRLKGKQQEVIILRFGLKGYESMSQAAIAREWGYSREYIRQVEKYALEKLNKYCRQAGIDTTVLVLWDWNADRK